MLDFKIVINFFSIVMLVASAGEMSISEPMTNPAFPEQCYDKTTNKGYKVQESFNHRTMCTIWTCQSGYRFKIEACEALPKFPEGGWCFIRDDADLSLSYPYCCPSVVCMA